MIRNARIASVAIILLGILLGLFVFFSQKEDSTLSRFKFRLGLDLSGGTQLIYDADTSDVLPADIPDAMTALRNVIERRVNIFGVSEPRVQVERGGVSGEENRLLVELPGVTDIDEAIKQIGETPLLEFRLQKSESEIQAIIDSLENSAETELDSEGALSITAEELQIIQDEGYVPTDLTGRYVERAQLQFNQTTGEPVVVINFNREGSEIFATITREHVGESLAIFLDGVPISIPRINEEIKGGEAVITGGFTPEEARDLARNLNYGALPIPIELVSTNTIGPTLGASVIDAGITAGIIGLALIFAFMILWYRVPGMVASVALGLYVVVMLVLFKMIPVTLTASGIAALILSVGMAVDANVIIFERIKEELALKKTLLEAINDGFNRAWPSIRDANLTSIISAIVLFYFGSSVVKGFALVFGIGVVVSMISAITVSKTFLVAISTEKENSSRRGMFASGFNFKPQIEVENK